MESEFKRRREFDQQIRQHLNQLYRDTVSSHARTLQSLLSRAQVANLNLLKSINSRLHGAIADLSKVGEVIELGTAVLEHVIGSTVIEELTDNLILHCITGHAARNPAETKAFLSGNTRDFGSEDVRRVLREAGIGQYFTALPDVHGWLLSKGA
jgi:hypothetical protein